jgi:hypothetical protein
MSIGMNGLLALPVALFVAIFVWPEGKTDNSTAAQKAEKIFAGVFPKTFEDGITISAPKAEGDVLAFTSSANDDYSDAFSNSEYARLMRNGICAGGKGGLRRYFKDGGKLRVDIKDIYGSVHKGSPVSNCS